MPTPWDIAIYAVLVATLYIFLFRTTRLLWEQPRSLFRRLLMVHVTIHFLNYHLVIITSFINIPNCEIYAWFINVSFFAIYITTCEIMLILKAVAMYTSQRKIVISLCLTGLLGRLGLSAYVILGSHGVAGKEGCLIDYNYSTLLGINLYKAVYEVALTALFALPLYRATRRKGVARGIGDCKSYLQLLVSGVEYPMVCFFLFLFYSLSFFFFLF